MIVGTVAARMCARASVMAVMNGEGRAIAVHAQLGMAEPGPSADRRLGSAV